MSAPISPPPTTNHPPAVLPAWLCNGVIGLRVRPMPLRNGLAVLNGYAGLDPITHVSSTPYAPYPLGGDIRIGQTWLSDAPDRLDQVDQTYDFSCGELRSRFTFHAEGTTAQVEVLTFCSRSLPTVALQEIQVRVDAACDLQLRVAVDPTGIPGHWIARHTETPGAEEPVVDGSLRWESLGGLSSCGAAYVSEMLDVSSPQRTCDRWGQDQPLVTTYAFRAKAGRRYRLRQMTSMVPSIQHHEPDWQATRLVFLAKQRGFEALRAENHACWQSLWRGRVHLVGAEERWQALADAAYFYLHTSVHPSSAASTSPFGLAQWYNYNYYYGHIMWDLETFAFPPLLLTQPPAARAMLDYRSKHLHAARTNAALYGYEGVQFPWESDPLFGEEATPVKAPTSVNEQHVTLDVAFAFAQFAHASGDEEYIREQAWPVLKGTAEWITSRATKTERGYEILQMTGPAEEPEPVNNDAYVNMVATVVMREALALAQRLGRAIPPRWEAIARNLYLPRDPKTGVIFNHDGYQPDEDKGGTPAAATGLFPFNYPADADVERATLKFYLDLAPKYIGTPMLSALMGVFAARLGDRARSAELFEKGYADFIQQPFTNTGEFTKNAEQTEHLPRVGPFFTNIGGFLMSCLFGLPGLRLGPGDPRSWCERPVVMPEGWDGIEVERIWVRDQPARLIAHHGDDHAHIELMPEDI